MFRFVVAICFFLTCFQVSANAGRQADKFLLVQFARPVSIVELDELTAYSFTVFESLNIEKTIYKIGYDSKKISDLAATDVIRKVPFFMSSQIDGPIHLRSTIPNDTLFSRQWHLNLIRATEAWDLSRTGVNRRGDTIVIAVIDDGLYLKHPDFQGNIWINYADTIGNGIDDDGNGYIDDHFGWNFVNRNNDISDSFFYKARHGSPVAGIIGAVGNNKTGVTGIMWHVKLMIVNIADTSPIIQIYQSDAVRAYSYVLHQRKLYNATNGKQGAFVVASNSSWGADGQFPHQAPLWCAMYDSLGKYGVLNCSAVSNDLGLVDTKGDLPTLCPSAHLIAVGSSTPGDNFYQCGESTTHVDLSAPGYNIFSTNAYTAQNINSNNVYNDSHFGTSFASPMVTAAIGILHSYACERILDTIKMNPAKGNAIMRKFVLEGVDVLPSLNGKSVTSGRLNIKKSMQIMDQYCFGEVSVDILNDQVNIRLFPNPGNGVLDVLSDQPISTVACYDVTGKLVSSEFNGEQLIMGDVNNGIYFIRVTVADQVFVFKYIKNGTF